MVERGLGFSFFLVLGQRRAIERNAFGRHPSRSLALKTPFESLFESC